LLYLGLSRWYETEALVREDRLLAEEDAHPFFQE
jgi:hypothetical protein